MWNELCIEIVDTLGTLLNFITMLYTKSVIQNKYI